MKRKPARDIPDFSGTKPKGTPRNDATAPARGARRPAAPPMQVKPQATSAKSGQRGR